MVAICTGVLADRFLLRVGPNSDGSLSSWRRHAFTGLFKDTKCTAPQNRLMHDHFFAQAAWLPTRRIDGAGISTTAQSTDNHSMAQASTVPKRRRRARGGAGVEGLASRGHGRELLRAPTLMARKPPSRPARPPRPPRARRTYHTSRWSRLMVRGPPSVPYRVGEVGGLSLARILGACSLHGKFVTLQRHRTAWSTPRHSVRSRKS